MNTTVRRGALVVLVVVSASCGSGSSTPTSSTGTSQLPAVPAPTPGPSTFPPLTGPSHTFVFDRQLSYPVSNYTRESRFVLYDNGAFVLQYGGLVGDYRGGYTEANGVIAFEWEDSSVAGPWGATGTIRGDTLTVQYNLIMQLSDFEDAVYARTP